MEPYWSSGGYGIPTYTLGIYRNPDNIDDWHFYIMTNVLDFNVYLYFLDITGIGIYSIEMGTMDDLNQMFEKNFIYIQKGDILEEVYLSLDNALGINVSKYDSVNGILVGTFSCNMYLSSNPNNIVPISGEFNINLSTYNPNQKPCWL